MAVVVMQMRLHSPLWTVQLSCSKTVSVSGSPWAALDDSEKASHIWD